MYMLSYLFYGVCRFIRSKFQILEFLHLPEEVFTSLQCFFPNSFIFFFTSLTNLFRNSSKFDTAVQFPVIGLSPYEIAVSCWKVYWHYIFFFFFSHHEKSSAVVLSAHSAVQVNRYDFIRLHTVYFLQSNNTILDRRALLWKYCVNLLPWFFQLSHFLFILLWKNAKFHFIKLSRCSTVSVT